MAYIFKIRFDHSYAVLKKLNLEDAHSHDQSSTVKDSIRKHKTSDTESSLADNVIVQEHLATSELLQVPNVEVVDEENAVPEQPQHLATSELLQMPNVEAIFECDDEDDEVGDISQISEVILKEEGFISRTQRYILFALFL